MDAFTRTARGAGRPTVMQSRVDFQKTPRRPVSWFAFEQPNPAIYARLNPSLPKGTSDQNLDSTAPQETRPVGETTTAPATSTVSPGSSQEIATSGKTVAPSIPSTAGPGIGSKQSPFGQTRSFHIHRLMTHLPTARLRSPAQMAAVEHQQQEEEDAEEDAKQAAVDRQKERENRKLREQEWTKNHKKSKIAMEIEKADARKREARARAEKEKKKSSL
ncbi:hypothetical protein F4778DRAFT_781968 [Xylariomycetidae sp. FL2044]|nr:hypothetical protein F4778DRAFT_781968 [Xylariomycetidae sp. FL2044]